MYGDFGGEGRSVALRPACQECAHPEVLEEGERAWTAVGRLRAFRPTIGGPVLDSSCLDAAIVAERDDPRCPHPVDTRWPYCGGIGLRWYCPPLHAGDMLPTSVRSLRPTPSGHMAVLC
jgi:hypothetical protein